MINGSLSNLQLVIEPITFKIDSCNVNLMHASCILSSRSNSDFTIKVQDDKMSPLLPLKLMPTESSR